MVMQEVDQPTVKCSLNPNTNNSPFYINGWLPVLASLALNHLLGVTSLQVRLPQVARLRFCANMARAVEWDLKSHR